MAGPQIQTGSPSNRPAPPATGFVVKPLAPQPKAVEPAYGVIDPTALVNQKVPRKHDMADPDGRIITYEFLYNTKTQVPFEHAMRFLKAGFIVHDPRGRRMNKSSIKNESTGAMVDLLPNQVIADLAELAGGALARRAQKIKGGDHFTADSPKADMIDFIMDNAPGWIDQTAKAATPAVPPGGDVSDLVDPD